MEQPILPTDPRLADLLLEWQSARDGGTEVDLHIICRDCPELVEPLRKNIDDLESMLKLLGETASESEAHLSDQTLPYQPRTQQSADLPIISGYEIASEIGRGGMGVVYRARQSGLNREVAIKMILGDGFGSDFDRSRLHRFQIEAEAVARVSHPGIVQIYEVGNSNGRPFLVLEYCGNGSLAKRLEGTPLHPRQAAKLCETLARAIDVAHRTGIVHRDLKPANILFAADNAPKIGDFGLARLFDSADDQTRSGAILGTPSYMPPEQALGTRVSPASDIYALGAILYECLTGRPPFKGTTLLETLEQVRVQEPVPPRTLNGKVTRDLETICLKCLRKEPAKRYETALALADDLRRFLNDMPIVARPVGRIERGLKWVKRDPLAAALTLLVFLSMGLGTTISVVKYRDAEHERGAAERALADGNVQRVAAEQARSDENEARIRADEALAQNRQRLALNLFLSYSRLCGSASRIANAKSWEEGQLARRDLQRMAEWLPMEDPKVKQTLVKFVESLADWKEGTPPRDVKQISLELARACRSWWLDSIGNEMPALVQETQKHMYSRICRVATELTTTMNRESGQFAQQEFWEMYWGELAIVESDSVATQMSRIGSVLEIWQPGSPPPAELAGLVADLHKVCNQSAPADNP